MNLTFEINQVNDQTIVFKLIGKIISDDDFNDVQVEVNDSIGKNKKNVIFDLEELTHMNSLGIGFFMRTLTKSRIINGDLVLCNIKGNVAKIFEISKLNEIYTICDSQVEAINLYKLQ